MLAPIPSTDNDTLPSILIIDEDPESRLVAAVLLRRSYDTRFAQDVEEACTQSIEDIPDLIIYDAKPDDINEMKSLERLKAVPEFHTTPVIVLIPDQEPNSRAQAFKLGADDVISKPYEISELLIRVKYLMKIHMYQEMLAERNRVIEKELDTARLLQTKLLPRVIPELPGFRFSATYLPMDKIGGDFYDFVTLDDFMHIFIADASGHGIPAAFLASLTKMAFEFYAPTNPSCDELLVKMDGVVEERSINNLYVTALCARLDLRTHVLYYANAGHCPLFLYRRAEDRVYSLEQNSMPLGAFNYFKRKMDRFYNEASIELKPGDRIIFYTDGITECRSPNRELYGMEGLERYMRKNKDLPTDSFSLKLVGELCTFAETTNLNDDLAYIVMDYIE